MSIQSNIKKIKSQIPDNVKLVAVSKTKPNEDIMQAYNIGHKIFGENKVQDLTEKYERLPKDIEWHFIGHLQRNKVKFIAPFVSLIHAVDSLRLLKKINEEAKKNNRTINCLLQIHIAEEDTKFGLNKDEVEQILENPEFDKLQNVKISGLMGMATYTKDKSQIKKEFKFLKNLFKNIKAKYFSDKESFTEISTGMSGDYEIAIEAGSTIVRIGSTIFGARNY
ncbi:MAG: YggS family pyridoxal phosphate-dependent enzyme [Bacteroidales bacterium]|nr:YggS family pyridoxal phosphate-dependent enzyme [Bacteroidales bacterium]